MKRTLLTLLLTFALLTPLACVKKDGGTTSDDSGPIKVGVYVDLTGSTAGFGQSTKNGIELAKDEINSNGGILNRQIQLVIEDDQGRPEQAKTVVSKLINQDKVHAVLGEVASTNSLAAAPVAQEAKIPMITPSSTNPKVTQVGDYIFRVCFIDPFQGGVAAKYSANTLKAKTAAIFGDVNSDYSKGLTEFFEREFNKLGGTVIEKQVYTQQDRDFKAQLTNIRAKNPDVIYIPGYYGEVGIISKQARELGMNQPILGGDGWDNPEIWNLGGEALKNTYISNHYSVDDPSPSIQKFVSAYKARFGGTSPDSLAALAYDAMYILADSIRRAGTTNPAKLRDAVAQTSNFLGVTGSITINASRDSVKPAVVLELDPATRHFVYKETIQPEGAVAAASPGASASPAASSAPAAAPSSSPAGTASPRMSPAARTGVSP
jgi:branched-chain amino acid transport system substrate-binding protein